VSTTKNPEREKISKNHIEILTLRLSREQTILQ